MLELKNANLSLLKDELKEAKSTKTVPAASIDKEYRVKNAAWQRALLENSILKRIYSTKTFPVKVQNITIDFNLYQSMLKKLRGFEIKLSVTERELILEYRKFGSASKGKFVLNDLSNYFEGFRHIPEAVFVDG